MKNSDEITLPPITCLSNFSKTSVFGRKIVTKSGEIVTRRDEESRGEPLPQRLEISLRESAHGFESHPLRHLRGWKQHSSPVFSRKALPDVIESYRQIGICRGCSDRGVVTKAVSDNRAERQQSIKQLREEWESFL